MLLLLALLLVQPFAQAAEKNRLKIAFVPDAFKGAFEYLATKEGVPINVDENMEQLEKDVMAAVKNAGFGVSSKNFNFTEEEKLVFYLSIPLPNSKDAFDADLFLWASYDIMKRKLKVGIQAVETVKIITYLIDVTNLKTRSDLNVQLNETIRMLLKRKSAIKEIVKVKADKIADPYDSVLLYEFSTKEGPLLGIKTNYEGFHKWVRNYECSYDDPKHQQVTLKTDSGHELYFQCGPTQKDRNNIAVETNYRPGLNAEKKTFIITSQKGFALNIDLEWVENKLRLSAITPAQNPFYPFVILIDSDGNEHWLNEYPPDE